MPLLGRENVRHATLLFRAEGVNVRTNRRGDGEGEMIRILVIGMCAMVSACVCSNAGIDSTDVKDTALSEDYNFNPMTREGMRKVRESASKNVRTY